MRRLIACILFFWFLFTASTSHAQFVKLEPSDLERDGRLGMSLAATDQYLFAGNADNEVFIYERGDAGEWTEVQKLEFILQTGADQGFNLATDGTRLIAGGWDGANGRGAAYVYIHDPVEGWKLEAELVPEGFERDESYAGVIMPQSSFGYSVAIYGNLAVVGAPGEVFTTRPGQGRVFVFRNDPVEGWIEDARLTADPESEDDSFGAAVALNNVYLVVGAPTYFFSSQEGRAYSFMRYDNVGWEQITTLEPDDGQVNNLFGASVAFDGNNAIIGAPTFSEVYAFGAVYETGGPFGKIHFLPGEKLTAPGDVQYFGASVAQHEDHVLIGSARTRFSGGLGRSGPAFLFEVDTGSGVWSTTDEFEAVDLDEFDAHGVSVALNSHDVFVGAPEHTLADQFEGAVYVYSRGIADSVDPGPEMPSILFGLDSFPNPALGSVTFEYELTGHQPSPTTLSVFDVLGRRVAVLEDNVQSAGKQQVVWTPVDLPRGAYLVRLQVRDAVASRSFVLTR